MTFLIYIIAWNFIRISSVNHFSSDMSNISRIKSFEESRTKGVSEKAETPLDRTDSRTFNAL